MASTGSQAPSGRRLSAQMRALTGAVLAIALSLFPTLGARAQNEPVCEGLEPPSPCTLADPQVNWFWSSNTKITVIANPPEGSPEQVPGVNLPTSLTDGVFGNASGAGSPISSGHIGVSLLDGDPDMRGYVKFDLGPIPPGSEVTRMIMTLDVSELSDEHIQRHNETNSKTPGTKNQGAAKILACAVTEPWAGMKVDGGDPPFATTVRANELEPADPTQGDGVTSQRSEPTSDCGTNVTGRPVRGGSQWEFDLTPIANRWLAGELFNEGVVLMPQANAPAQSWTVEFHGAELSVLPTTDVPQPVPLPVAPPEPPSDRVTYINEDEAGFAEIQFIAPAAPVLPPPPPPAVGGQTNFPSFTSPPSVSAPPDDPPVVAQPAPQVPTAAANPGFWWLMLPIGALGTALFSSAVAADALPVGAAGGNRVAAVLRNRRLEAAAGEETTPEATSD